MTDEEESSERLRDPVHIMLITCCVFGFLLSCSFPICEELLFLRTFDSEKKGFMSENDMEGLLKELKFMGGMIV